uniref:Ras-related protein Rab-27A n=1 Tax=Cacopsylla melanoneura TaxID=428564 RepID=A0A8D8Q7C0_9HEMI
MVGGKIDYDYSLKFLTIGNAAVGKTSFLVRYADDVFETKYKSTVGIDYREKRLVYKSHENDRSQRIFIQLWDTAGQERFLSLTTGLYRGTMGFLLIFDVTNQKSFDDVQKWLLQIKTHAYTENPDIILCGNKIDLVSTRLVSEKSAVELATKFGIKYFEVSSATGHNVEEAVKALVDAIMDRIERSSETDDLPNRIKNGDHLSTPDRPRRSCSC